MIYFKISTLIVAFYILQLNKIVKGSFMKHINNNKMTNTLLYINKKSVTGNDEKKNPKYEDKSEIKSMNTITAKAGSNPFAYLLRNDNKQEITNGIMVRYMYYYFNMLNVFL